HASRSIAIPGGNSLSGTKIYGKWFISGEGETYESASFETTVFGDAAGNLEAPSDLDASDDERTTSVDLTWTDVVGASHYDLYRGNSDSFLDATFLATVEAGEESYSDAPISADSLFYYWIVAVNEHEASPPSASETGSTFDFSGFTLNATQGESTEEVTLTWADEVVPDRYVILRATTLDEPDFEEIGEWSGSGALEFTDTNGDPERTYYYRLEAYITTVLLATSEVATGWRSLAPPTNVDASSNLYQDRVEVGWNEEEEATTYRVYRQFQNVLVFLGETSSSSYSDTSGTPATDYLYSVSSVNEWGEGSRSETANGYRAISAPTDLSAVLDAATNSIVLTWSLAESVSSYAILRSTTGNFEDAVEIATTTGFVSAFADDTGDLGTDYTYWVASIDEDDGRILVELDAVSGKTGIVAPDLLVGASAGFLKGDGVYNSNGSGQVYSKLTRRYRTHKLVVASQNDGTINDVLSYRGSGGNRFFKCTYVRTSPDAANLTSAIKAGTATSTDLAGGESELIAVKVKPLRARQRSRGRTYRLTNLFYANSQRDVSEVDCVKVKTTAKY
ncbi:MAG: hypothetical protein AAGC68_05175, partial [Verrucomicrobiota bacterium]